MPETTIGFQALVFSVSNEVWTGGVHALSKADLTRIYEATAKSWKEFGGPDRPIKFYNPEPGKGVWEFFVTWLYGDMRKAPAGRGFETAGSSEETQNLIEFNAGAIGILPPAQADRRGRTGSRCATKKGRWSSRRAPMCARTPGPSCGPSSSSPPIARAVRCAKVLEFMLSAEGQEIVRRSDMVSVVPEASE